MEDIDFAGITKKHNINLDRSIVDSFAPIPENLPDWKKDIIKKKNEKILNDAIESAVANKDPYAGVPQWKKELLMKRDQEKAEYKRRKSEDLKVKEDETKKFESKPEWKKDIIKRRISRDEISPR